MTTMQRPLEKTRHELLWQAVQQTRPDIRRLSSSTPLDPPAFTAAPFAPAADPIEPTLDSLQIPKRPSRRATGPACAASQTSHDQESRNSDLVKHVCHEIDSHLDEHPDGLPSLAQLSQAVGVSASHLQRVFKKETGLTPRQYAHAGRLERFKSLVRDGSAVTTALFDSGFSSSSRLYEDADGQFGMTPGRYRRGGAGMTISYLVAESPLGALLVAATGKGICSVKLGDDPSALLKDLQAEFPAADFREGDEASAGLAGVSAGIPGRRAARPRFTPRHTGHGLSAPSLAYVAVHPLRRDPVLPADGPRDRLDRKRRPGRRQRLRLESCGVGHPLSSCGAEGRLSRRLPVGPPS